MHFGSSPYMMSVLVSLLIKSRSKTESDLISRFGSVSDGNDWHNSFGESAADCPEGYFRFSARRAAARGEGVAVLSCLEQDLWCRINAS